MGQQFISVIKIKHIQRVSIQCLRNLFSRAVLPYQLKSLMLLFFKAHTV